MIDARFVYLTCGGQYCQLTMHGSLLSGTVVTCQQQVIVLQCHPSWQLTTYQQHLSLDQTATPQVLHSVCMCVSVCVSVLCGEGA